jgi:hypothetical protein
MDYNTQEERIRNAIATEIVNMMKLNYETVSIVEKWLTKMSKCPARSPVQHVQTALNDFYAFVRMEGVRPKQRRGIGYKVNKILEWNTGLMKPQRNPEWEKI